MPAEAKQATTRSPSVVAEALVYEMPGQFFSLPSNFTSFCQRFLPSARSRQSRLRTLPSLLAWVRKMRLFQRMGVELPANSRGTFHFTFLELLHSSGRLVSVEYP